MVLAVTRADNTAVAKAGLKTSASKETIFFMETTMLGKWSVCLHVVDDLFVCSYRPQLFGNKNKIG